MKILLRETVEKLGDRGEIVDVAPGYARNYLIPRRLAVPATEANFRQLEIEKARIARLIAKEQAEREAARQRLEAVSCTIIAAASPEGRLYGSVGPQQIAEALKQEGFEIDPASIRLEEPFREVGVYLVEIDLAPGVAASTRVWIVAE